MIKLFDENKNLVNLSNSILNYFNITTYNPSLKQLDEILAKNKNRKIALILLDGFGKYIQEEYKQYCPFILKHKKEEITSIFPPTTVAATTALMSGKYPCQTGWFGWTEKINDYPLPVLMFYSQMSDGVKIKEDTYDLFPYKSIVDSINEKGYKAEMLHSFRFEDDIASYFKRAEQIILNNDFSYIYHVQPDEYLHMYGVGSTKLNDVIKQLDDSIEKLVNDNKDVLFITIADHGHKNIKYCYVEQYSDFYDCLDCKIFSVEPRAASFNVKKDKLDEFYSLAKKYYEDKFYILSKEEVIKEHVFGYGEKDLINKVIGDYLFISKGEYGFNYKGGHELSSQHAGSTLEERILNLALYNC